MKAILLVLLVSRGLLAASWPDDLAQAERLRQAGKDNEAEQVYQQVLDRAQQLNAAQLNALAIELNRQKRYREAEWSYRRSLEAWDLLWPDMAVSRFVTEENLGTLLQQQGRYAEAEVLLLDASRKIEAASGSSSLNGARAASALAALYQAWGQPGKGETWAVQADQILWTRADVSQDERFASRRMRASLLLAEGKYPEGATLMRASLPNIPDRQAVGAYNDLATAEIAQNHLTEAERLAVHALELARRVFPAQHPLVAVSLNNLAQILRFEGHYLEAEAKYREAISAWEHALGPQHPDTAKGVMNLAALYSVRGREAGAEDLYRRAASVFEACLGKTHPLTLVAQNELGEVLRAQHRYSESERLSRATLEPLASSLGEEDPRVIRALSNYARLLQETNRPREAAAISKRVKGMTHGFTTEHP